jgi:hypothetical protein
MDKMMPIAFVLATLTLIAAASAAEQKFRKLSGEQIRGAFSGMELSDEVHWYELFEKSGTLSVPRWDASGRENGG